MENIVPSQTPKTIRKKATRFFVPAVMVVMAFLILAIGGLYAWYFRYNSCDVQGVEASSVFMAGQLNRFDDVAQVASTAYRTDLTRPVYELQQTYMDTQAVEVPACLRTAKAELLDYMSAVIDAFQAYGASEPDSTVLDLFERSDTHYENFRAELKTVKECAPYCAPWH